MAGNVTSVMFMAAAVADLSRGRRREEAGRPGVADGVQEPTLKPPQVHEMGEQTMIFAGLHP